MREKIINYIRAGYAGLYLVSSEEQRVDAEVKSISTELKYRLFFWSVVEGLVDTTKKSTTDANDPQPSHRWVRTGNSLRISSESGK